MTAELATRDEIRAEFAATRADFAALRAEIRADLRAFNRNMIIGFIVTNVIIGAVVIGAVAVAVQVILAAIPNP